MKIFIVAFLLAAALGCNRVVDKTIEKTLGTTEGVYRRVSYRVIDSSGHQISDEGELKNAIPRQLTILAFHGYEIEAGGLRIRGKYRFEKDSIFIDDAKTGVVQLFGSKRGDTITLASPAILIGAGVPPGYELRIRFIRQP